MPSTSPRLWPLCLLAACHQPEAPPPTVVLFSWDTVRADAVGESGTPGCGTPRLDSLAAEGVSFEHARSSVPLTLPAHASMLTGLHPHRHGARVNGRTQVDPEAWILSEDLSARGWATAAFVSAPVLAGATGLGRGFSHYDESPKPSVEGLYRPAEATAGAALEWLDALPPDRPAFLFVHLFDPHRPWRAPRPFVEACDGDLYRAEIAYTDHWTGRILDGLASVGRLDSAVVAVVADHGESLGEHGEESHGYFAYDSTLKVPFVLWSGPSTPHPSSGRRVSGPVTHADLPATIGALLDLPLPAGDGISLLPFLESGDVVPPRSLPIETIEPYHRLGTAPILGVLDSEERVWFDLPQPEMYALRSDPHQLNNLWKPELMEQARSQLAAFPDRFDQGDRVLEERTLTDEQLAALGYLSMAEPSQAALDELPDPKQLIALHRGISETERPSGEHPLEALRALRALRDDFGLEPRVALYMAQRFDRLGRFEQAAALLEQALAAHPEHPELGADIQRRAAEREEQQALVRAISQTLAGQPDHPDAPFDLALALHKLERHDEAEPLYLEVLDEDPDDDQARLMLARLMLERDPQGAAALLLEGAQRPGHAPTLDCELGKVLHWWLDRDAEAVPWIRSCWAGGHPRVAWQTELVFGRPAHPIPEPLR